MAAKNSALHQRVHYLLKHYNNNSYINCNDFTVFPFLLYFSINTVEHKKNNLTDTKFLNGSVISYKHWQGKLS